MIEIIKELDIEVSKPNVFQAVVAKQYDMNTRFIKATFVDDGNKIFIDPEKTVSVVINALRTDGESKGFDGVVNEDGTVTVPLHSWMLELVGTVICDISVIDLEADDNKKLTTTSFTLIVEKAAYGGGDVTTDPQYDVLVSLLETCSEASAVAEEALAKSNEANSKYVACVEATENANEASEAAYKAAKNANAVKKEIQAGGYIESLKEMNNGDKFSFWVGSNEEYSKIETKVENCLYITTDDPLTHIRFWHRDYTKGLIALCKCSAKDKTTSTSSIGQLILNRTNGLYTPANVNISITDSIIDDFKIRASLYGVVPTGHGMSIKPCTFTYEGVVYGGVEIYSSNAEPSLIDFIGICENIKPFFIEYCRVMDGGLEVPDKSLYDSINFNNVIYDSVFKQNTDFVTNPINEEIV